MVGALTPAVLTLALAAPSPLLSFCAFALLLLFFDFLFFGGMLGS